MRAARWRRLKDLFHEALHLGPEREAFLTRATAGDRELAEDILSLLAANDNRRDAGLPSTTAGSTTPTSAPGPGERLLELVEVEEELSRALEGRYSFEGPVGRGGMALVLQATDLRHDRPVAVKVLTGGPAGGIDARRFLAEIRVTAKLHHPHILPLFDSGEVEGRLFYVMPLVAGESLQQLLARQRPLPFERVRRIVEDVASALDYAHSSGVVHRDIKPGNILLSGDAVFVADFGIARALSGEARRLTEPGGAIGTPHYMSPEQIDSTGDPGPQADIYALGCVAYEMLTGEPPFSGVDAGSVLRRHLAGPVTPPSTLRDQLNPGADAVLTRALAKSPADRWATAGEFAAALAAALAAPASPAPVTGAPPVAAWRLEQEIRFCTAPDGVRLAYAVSGQGPPLVKASNWLSHLEFDAESPLWRHWWIGLSERFRFIRYDERLNGLSDWEAADLSFEAWVRDLETVVDAAGLERFVLLGVSKGGAIATAYAARHPERVSHLVLHGAFAVGALVGRPSDERRRRVGTEVEMIRIGWGGKNPAFRQAFTTMFFPEASAEQARWFNELQRVSASPENAARMLEGTYVLDVRDEARRVRTPTLVLHCRDDARVPFEQGRMLAGLIPGAKFVPLPSPNHIPLEYEPAWQRFMEELRAFTGASPSV